MLNNITSGFNIHFTVVACQLKPKLQCGQGFYVIPPSHIHLASVCCACQAGDIPPIPADPHRPPQVNWTRVDPSRCNRCTEYTHCHGQQLGVETAASCRLPHGVESKRPPALRRCAAGLGNGRLQPRCRLRWPYVRRARRLCKRLGSAGRGALTAHRGGERRERCLRRLACATDSTLSEPTGD